jgi:hypothetical protein
MSFRKTQGNVSIHHNLLFSNRDRHPTLGGGDPKRSTAQAVFDFRNNDIYNREGACNLATGQFDVVANYWRPGQDIKPCELTIQPQRLTPCAATIPAARSGGNRGVPWAGASGSRRCATTGNRSDLRIVQNGLPRGWRFARIRPIR